MSVSQENDLAYSTAPSVHSGRSLTQQHQKSYSKHILGAVESGNIVEVVRVQKEVVHDLELCRLEKHCTLVVGKRPVLVDGVVGVTLVY